MNSRTIAVLSAAFAVALTWSTTARAQSDIKEITSWQGGYLGLSLGRADGERRTLGTGSLASNSTTLLAVTGGYCINSKNNSVVSGQTTEASCIGKGSGNDPHVWVPAITTPTPSAVVPSGPSTSSFASAELNRSMYAIKGGYNWQDAEQVYGVEVDHTWLNNGGSSLTTSSTVSVDGPQPVTMTTTAESRASLKQLVTLRGRFGLTRKEGWLPYLTGGLALGRVSTEGSATYSFTGIGGSPVTQGFGETRWRAGYTLGAGVDYRIDRNVILNVAYLYVNLGKHQSSDSYNVLGPNDKSISGSAYSEISTHMRLLSVGLKYQF